MSRHTVTIHDVRDGGTDRGAAVGYDPTQRTYYLRAFERSDAAEHAVRIGGDQEEHLTLESLLRAAEVRGYRVEGITPTIRAAMRAEADAPRQDQWLSEHPDFTYRDACLWCDRNGVLGIGTEVPETMLPIARASWLRLWVAATGLALRSDDGSALVVPGMREAGEDSSAALDAAQAFKLKLDAALKRPLATRRNS